LGFILGKFYGGTGVVIALVIALVVGSGILIFSYHAEHRISSRVLLPSETLWLVLASGTGIAIDLLFYYQLNERMNISVLGAICVLAFIAIILVPAWFHPMRTQMIRWFARDLA
jgi:hypothetical protein